MKYAAFVFPILLLFSCDGLSKKDHAKYKTSIEPIELGKQYMIFEYLMAVTDSTISNDKIKDSLAFLILPVQASCPSCRKKTIDSLMKYKDNLTENHFIVISAIGGKKTINGFFKEQNYNLPCINNKLFLDTTNKAYKLNLFENKPTFYYTHNQKAYKKVAAIPVTIKDDLREFFQGIKNDNINN